MPPFLPYHPGPAEPVDAMVVLIACIVLIALLGVVLGLSYWYSRRHEQHHAGHSH